MSQQYLGDFEGTETFPIEFTTYNSSGASVSMTGSPSFSLGDISIYKGTSSTARSSSSGIVLLDTDGVDINGITGLHGFSIDLSDDTDAGFYAAGNDYYVVVSNLEIDSQIVSLIAARFSIQNRSVEGVRSLLPTALVDGKMDSYVDGLTVGAGGISTVATGATVTTGVETLTYASTEELDGTTHDVEDTGGNTEFYYEFNVGVSGIATEVRWDGYAQSNGDSYTIKGYDWVSASWKTIGTVSGTNATSIIERTFVVTRNMTGTGANAGVVRWQVTSSDGTKFATDRIVVEYTASVEAGIILHSGVAQGGSSNTITLDATANATDDFYNHAKVIISSGTGSEQERIIVDYNGTTKVATIAPPWVTQPDSTSAFEVEPGNCHAETGWGTIKVGLVQSATSTTAVLDSTASTIDDYYNNDLLHIDAGTGEGQIRVITDYVGSTKTATIHTAWTTTPDTTSEYIVEEAHPYVDAQVSTVGGDSASVVADAVWDEAFAGHTTNGTYGKLVKNLGEGVVSADGQVVDGSPSLATTTSFDTNLTFSDDTFYDDKVLVFIDGALAGQSKPIKTSTASGGNLTFDSVDAFVAPPANGDSFIILATHVHPITQIAQNVRSEMDSNSTQLTAIVADTNEIQTDLADGGRIDLILDELTTQGDTNETKLDTIDTVVDAVLVDTNEIQTDLADGGRLDLIFDELTTQGDTNETKLDTIDTVVDAVLVDTNEIQTDLADGGRIDLILDELTTQGDTNETKLDTIDTVVDAILVDTGTTIPASIATVDATADAILVDTASTIPGLITALNDVSASDLLTTTMTESYASAGSAPSLAQIQFEIRALLAEHAAAGTTLTTKRLDGSTTAATYTFDDGDNPTSLTRST